MNETAKIALIGVVSFIALLAANIVFFLWTKHYADEEKKLNQKKCNCNGN